MKCMIGVLSPLTILMTNGMGCISLVSQYSFLADFVLTLFRLSSVLKSRSEYKNHGYKHRVSVDIDRVSVDIQRVAVDVTRRSVSSGAAGNDRVRGQATGRRSQASVSSQRLTHTSP